MTPTDTQMLQDILQAIINGRLDDAYDTLFELTQKGSDNEFLNNLINKLDWT